MRFLYFYLMKEAPHRVPAVAPRHAAYWRALASPAYLGGPFVDRSGGLIIFEANSGAEAERLVANDAFLREGLIERHWLREWVINDGASLTPMDPNHPDPKHHVLFALLRGP